MSTAPPPRRLTEIVEPTDDEEEQAPLPAPYMGAPTRPGILPGRSQLARTGRGGRNHRSRAQSWAADPLKAAWPPRGTRGVPH